MKQTNPVRILYVARGGPIAGSQRQLLNLLHRLDRTRYEPVVLCSDGPGLKDRLADLGIDTRTHPRLIGWRQIRYLLRRYFFRRFLYNQVAGQNIGLIHCSYPWYSQYCLFLASRLGCPCVIHVRSPMTPSAVRKSGLAKADRLIAISAHSRRDLIEAAIPPEKVELIYDSIDTDRFCPRPEARQTRRDEGTFVFGLVGRIAPDKYQMEFVRAAERIASRCPAVQFLIVGQDRDTGYARRLMKYVESRSLSGRIIFTGQSNSMPGILSQIDVLVTLSGGSVMYEAMACGVPVLSAGYTRPEDVTHVIPGSTGILVNSRDPDDLARAMESMLTDSPALRRLEQNTRRRVLDHLTDTAMAQRTQALYAQLLSPQTPPQ